jgi:fluoroquinolone transport system permease protein
MRAAAAFRALGPIDARAISRDSMLVWMFFLPLLMGLIVRFGLPPLAVVLHERFDFDLAPYHHLLSGYLLLMLPPMLVGLVAGFLLLDERDDQTLTALLVTPLSLDSYLLYRIGTPLVLCTAMTAGALAFSGLSLVPWPALLPVLLLAAMEGPIMALFLASFAANKVQGFAVMKAMGTPLALPVLAWFVDLPLQLFAGLIPTYWPLRAYWSAGDPGALYAASLVIGFAMHAGILWWLVRRFSRVLHR